MTTALEHYAMIGDGETAALVSRSGSIDWLCLPRFDSPACCCALLGNADNGHWSIAPEGELREASQRYMPGTMIVETELASDEGRIRLTDFMIMRRGQPTLLRMVTGLSGSVQVKSEARFRFDYGHMPPWTTATEDGVDMRVGPDEARLSGSEPFEIQEGSIVSRFRAEEDSRHVFVLQHGPAKDRPAEPVDADAALSATREHWRDWIGRFEGPFGDDRYDEALRRSLLTLKALVHRPTGGLVAAPTTSLPEQPGGSMNWDYRFCWLRDATFTLSALVDCGYVEEACAWRDWILRAVANAPDKMQILYRVDGSRRLDEAELPWLSGYRFARPVRVGNAAAGQLQLDVYGELIRTLHASERSGMDRTEQGRFVEHAIVDHVRRIWVEPDSGLWESRGKPRHYTYSKVMTWVALQRFLDGKGGEEISEEERRETEELRDHIHDVICREAFDTGLGSFTNYFGGQTVDASLLLLPKVGFLPADDERMKGTVALIEERLVEDGLVRRHLMEELVPEGAFLACSFWLAECQLWQGRRDDAVRTIDRALEVRSEVGLLSEEYDVSSRRLAGNYPQALSHLAMIQALLSLAKSGGDGHERSPPRD